jgi:GntR family transcriptional regulator
MIKKLPKDTCLGVVSLSPGILSIAEILIHSLRGEEIFVKCAQVSDRPKLRTVVRSARIILSDPVSHPFVMQAIAENRDDLIRFPEVICSEPYIGEKSINTLKLELGLG